MEIDEDVWAEMQKLMKKISDIFSEFTKKHPNEDD